MNQMVHPCHGRNNLKTVRDVIEINVDRKKRRRRPKKSWVDKIENDIGNTGMSRSLEDRSI